MDIRQLLGGDQMVPIRGRILNVVNPLPIKVPGSPDSIPQLANIKGMRIYWYDVDDESDEP